MAKKAKRKRVPRPQPFIDGLTVKQTKAVNALLRGGSTEEAAKAAGVARGTISNWLNHEYAFSATLKRLQNEMVAHTITSMRREASKSVDFLAKTRDDKKVSAAVRVRAASKLLELAKLDGRTELEIPLSLDEMLTLNAINERRLAESREDRKEHNQHVREWFYDSRDGRRWNNLKIEVGEMEEQLSEIEQKRDKLYRQSWDLTKSARGQIRTPEYRRAEELDEAYYRLLAKIQKKQRELEQLDAKQDRLFAGVVRDPNKLATDAMKIYKLAKRAGADWISEKMIQLGRSEDVADLLTALLDKLEHERWQDEARKASQKSPPEADPDEDTIDAT